MAVGRLGRNLFAEAQVNENLAGRADDKRKFKLGQ